MRYIVTDRRDLDLQQIEDALRLSDPAYAITNRQTERVAGDLVHGNKTCAQIEINRPGDGLFQEEIEELIEFAQEADGKGRKEVLNCLKKARATVAVQVLIGEGDPNVVLDMIAPLWQWLFKNRDGLLQADGEGYYRESDLILKVE